MTGPVVEATAAAVAVAFPLIAPAVTWVVGDRHQRRIYEAACQRWSELHGGRHEGTARVTSPALVLAGLEHAPGTVAGHEVAR